ncbi:MAG TPA: heavy metal-associated domain-containing protein [Alphaproteobacteria bacterium]|nr:heavy metal-associated domain-containing protein [Alphaproteobacteria bacterium]
MNQTLLIAALLAAVSLPALANHDGKGHEGHAGMHQMPDGTWMNNHEMATPKADAKPTAVKGDKRIVANVNGLVCDYCAQSIKKTLMKEPGVADVNVDLSAKTVTVGLKADGKLEEARLKGLLKDAGYDMTTYKVE